ncbi:ABC transporter substrate-binding protein [Brevibacillus choshinensis]|uniref:SgrR family transcriptional regulator n=1 Tax=Brevibacillus choshinensis TaxID=54911 RepID=A0ABX7FRA0_BRECH|nr:ABC transporter substrate-binding protein [Brevibacillus choshinensis]QRG67807.1 SgrR family transcriptional regulator [Brevibacillus choshinensis]
MKSQEHFMQMLFGLSEWETDREQSISVEALSEILCCTPRNVKLILRKWENEGLLRWRAGVGRGNHSTLTILCDTSDFFSAYFKNLLSGGKITEAVGLVQNEKLPARIKRGLQQIWDSQFGFVLEEGESTSLDVLRIPRQRGFSTLDPAFVAVAAESHFLRQMCHRLVYYDQEQQTFLPELAHAWECNEERTAWTFYLRKGVRFHHGKILNGKDVEYTMRRLIDLDSPYRWQMDDVDWIEHQSERIITFHLRQPNSFFLHYMGSQAMSILPHDVPFSEQAVIGTGPFRMAEYTDERLVLEAFDDYYRERAVLDRVEIWIVTGHPGSRQHYELPNREQQSDSGSEGKDIVFEETGCNYLAFNFRRPGVQHDYAFRIAMRMVMDRNQLIKKLGEYAFSPAGSFLPSRSRAMTFSSSTLEEAASWLSRSSYQGETLSVFISEGKLFDIVGKWMKRRCQQIGIQIKLVPMTKANFLSDHVDLEADMAIMGEVFQSDVELGLIELYKNKSTMVYRFMDDHMRALVDDKLSEVLRMENRDKRMRALDLIEQAFEEQQWLLCNFHVKRIDRYHPALQGFVADSFGWLDFSKLWVKSFVTSL